jgi:LysM repeat protein
MRSTENFSSKNRISILSIFIFLMLNSNSLNSQTQFHVVDSGQTAFSIAKKYNIPLRHLLKSNQIDSSNFVIKKGDTLKIIPMPKVQEAIDNNTYHIVAPQETVYSILKKYPELNKRDFYVWNGIDSALNNIKIGQKLIVKKNETASTKNNLNQESKKINTDALFTGLSDNKKNTENQNSIKEKQNIYPEKTLEEEYNENHNKTSLHCVLKIIENKTPNSCIFAYGKVGSVIKIINTQNGKSAYARIIGRLNKSKAEPEVGIMISSHLAQKLEVTTEKAMVQIKY